MVGCYHYFLMEADRPCHSSSVAASPEQKFEYRICAHLANIESRNQTIRGYFNETTVWEDWAANFALYDLPMTNTSSSTLDHLLGGLITQTKHQFKSGNRRLDQVGRKVVGLLLACSLFKLCGSPWLQHGFERENIHLLPNKSPTSSFHYWCPHIFCNLSLHSSPRSLPEDVAALGVLILELEANLTAEWTEDDEDYDTATKSNRTRLSRILKEWKGDLTDFYRGIGLACFSFENLVEDFDHPKIDQGLRNFAILYKCIVNPLYQKLVSDFGAAACLFEGTSGLSVPERPRRASTSNPLVLYDDWESPKPDKKSQYAEDLVEKLNSGFLSKIKCLRDNAVSFAKASKGIKTPERIRIAVLDTGIDTTDTMIKYATRSTRPRIQGKRSWVGSINSYEDEYGHGTHVTRLLLQMAPAAEIYVAKITDGKTVDPENMTRIAEAIDWAVKEWKVHVISMSFGFESRNQAIEDAIERAFKADTLMFAAASNEGGNKKKRSRPGRNNKVICIHACDGKGNKGDMNPNPEKREDNFTTLGVAVQSQWKKNTVYKSGTSFATPIAAAFAADILEFANFKCKLSEEDKRLLYKQDGMQAVFRAMSIARDDYDYLQPEHLWDNKDDDKVATMIQDILTSQ